MNRRNFICGIVTGCAALILSSHVFISPAAAASRTLVYISAGDCTYCRQWEATEQQSFAARCAAKGIRFRKVVVQTLRDIRNEKYWPADLKPLLAKFSDMGGTPRFLLFENGELRTNAWGIADWRQAIAPLVR
jgi:hypothetical protein